MTSRWDGEEPASHPQAGLRIGRYWTGEGKGEAVISEAVLHADCASRSAAENVQGMCDRCCQAGLLRRSGGGHSWRVTFPAGQFARAGDCLGLSCTSTHLGGCADGCGILPSSSLEFPGVPGQDQPLLCRSAVPLRNGGFPARVRSHACPCGLSTDLQMLEAGAAEGARTTPACDVSWFWGNWPLSRERFSAASARCIRRGVGPTRLSALSGVSRRTIRGWLRQRELTDACA